MRPHPRSGMTLMELVIALAITGLVAAAGTATLGAIVDHKLVIVRGSADVERAVALREQLHEWFASGEVLIQSGGLPRVGNSAGSAIGANSLVRNLNTSGTSLNSSTSATTAVTAAASTGDELTFTTTAPNPAMTPSVRIRLFVDNDLSTVERGLTIEYQASTQAPLQRLELERSIGSMKVEFLDQRTTRWYESTEAATITPIAFRLTLLPPDGGKLPRILQLPFIFHMGQPAVR
ncbi:MAG: prepilin-type N-terminal cleavage/methylation domain-containing protein [Gemmatimonadales bacterium]